MNENCEILAPAGDQEALEAALESGAEAVYFGLDEGFNARARASNFKLDGLDELVRKIHLAGAKAYLALNTLVFESELPKVQEILARVARAGVDAVIVQDPGLALLAHSIAPELQIHASTQMTISSPEAAKFAQTLGVSRVVVPRELSVHEIRLFRAGTDLELEVFIMGALCVAWSGQCLSSEAWGGRSANRGKCAQACRLPYELVVDGETRPLGEVQYLLSPQDLGGFRAVEALLEIGVTTLKIEGRQKAASYVARAVSSLKRWRDSLRVGAPNQERLAEDLRDLSLVYSRGLSDGFLAGSDHQSLVEGVTPRHRGLQLGRVREIRGKSVWVEPVRDPQPSARGEVLSPLPALGGSSVSASGAGLAPVEPRQGMGVVFRQGDDQEKEQGGPIFDVQKQGEGWRLTFGRPGPLLHRVRPGARVYLTSDPKLVWKKGRESAGRLPLRLLIEGEEGSPLTVQVAHGALQFRLSTELKLQGAQKRALSREVLEENLAALGGTPFYLAELQSRLSEGLFLPLSELRQLRRALVDEMIAQLDRTRSKRVVEGDHLEKLKGQGVHPGPGSPYIVALCRNSEQLEAAIEAGVREVELDWMELVGVAAAVARGREAGLRVGLATVRIQKPGEQAYDRRIEKLLPDSVLLRHWAGVMHFLESKDRPALHGDFSLNVTNSITALHLLSLGLDTITASHDLDRIQLFELVKAMDPRRLAVTVHHHIPTFHTEHCVYSALLSDGRDFRSCGRPCEEHHVSLRDRVNLEHPVIVDVGCRNTVFNAQAQSAAFLIPDLVQAGVERLRVEFVRESRAEALEVLRSYNALLMGEIDHRELVRRVGAHEQFGVTKGTMQLIV